MQMNNSSCSSNEFSINMLPDFIKNDEIQNIMSLKLQQFLEFKKQIETPLQASCRQQVLTRLEDALSNWIYATYNIRFSQHMQHYKRGDRNGRLGIIQPYGSYYLKAHTPSSDIDSIVLLPSYVKTDDFFLGFLLAVKSIVGVSHGQHIKAAHPLLNITIDGYEFDMVPAIMDLVVIPHNLDFLEKQTPLPCKPETKQTLGSIAVNVWIAEQTNFNPLLFQSFVRLIKIQTNSSGMNGNKLGMFGGVNIALLCANIMICNRSQRINIFNLVYSYFYFYSRYDWRIPLKVNSTVEYAYCKDDAMQLPTPAFPIFNSLQKVTESTRTVIVNIWSNCLHSTELLFQIIQQQSFIRQELLKPCLMQLCFMAHDHVSQQYSSFLRSFLESKDYKAGYLVIQVSHKEMSALKSLRDKIDPLLVGMFKQLQKLKDDAIGGQATIDYIRPWPEWIEGTQFDMKQAEGNQKVGASFFVGLARTDGEKVWLTQKLGDLIAQFKLKIRNKFIKDKDFSKEPTEIYDIQILLSIWNDAYINVLGRKQIISELGRLGISGFGDVVLAQNTQE